MRSLIKFHWLDVLTRSPTHRLVLSFCFSTASPAKANWNRNSHQSHHTMDSKNVVVCDNGTGVLLSHSFSNLFFSYQNQTALHRIQQIFENHQSQIIINRVFQFSTSDVIFFFLCFYLNSVCEVWFCRWEFPYFRFSLRCGEANAPIRRIAYRARVKGVLHLIFNIFELFLNYEFMICTLFDLLDDMWFMLLWFCTSL